MGDNDSNYQRNFEETIEDSDMRVIGKTSAQIFNPSSSTVSCEDMLLEDMKSTTKNKDDLKNSASSGLEALLKLAQNPIKAKAQQSCKQKIAEQDVCTNRSAIFTNKEMDFDPDKLDQYPVLENSDKPKVGQILAFMCLQIGPDYTPQMTRYVGELKKIDDNGQVLFLIIYDENEGKNPSEKFEIDGRLDGLLLKNRDVDFVWSQLFDIRKIK